MMTLINSACAVSALICIPSMFKWIKLRRTHMIISIAKVLAASLVLLGLGIVISNRFGDVDIIGKNIDTILGCVIGGLFVGTVNTLHIDVFSRQSVANMIHDLKLYREAEGHHSVKTDKYKIAFRIAWAAALISVVSFIPVDKKILIQLLIAIVAGGNIILNPRYIGWCPYCNHQISGLTRLTTITYCHTCNSTVSIENRELVRVLGRAENVSVK